MKRRTFIKNTLVAGIASNLFFAQNVFATEPKYPDLVIAKGKKPEELVKLSIKAIGGLKQFGLTGKRILLKPTIQWNAKPSDARNTNPNLIYRLIRECYDANAWEVYLLDHTTDDWRLCYMNSGIEKASKEAFGKIMPANERYLYKESDNGFLLHKLVHKCDFIINVPKLNYEPESDFSGALTNLRGLAWENGKIETTEGNQKILDLVNIVKPALTVMDATVVGSGKNRRQLDILITGKDCIAIDILACQQLGINPKTVEYLNLAATMGKCELTTNKLTIQKIYT